MIIKDKFRHFNMHSQRITRLSWSPHSIELLASSSYDGSVQVMKFYEFSIPEMLFCKMEVFFEFNRFFDIPATIFNEEDNKIKTEDVFFYQLKQN